MKIHGELMHGAQAGTGAGKYGKVGSIPSIFGVCVARRSL